VGVVKRWVLRGLWRRLVGVGIIGPGLLGAPALIMPLAALFPCFLPFGAAQTMGVRYSHAGEAARGLLQRREGRKAPREDARAYPPDAPRRRTRGGARGRREARLVEGLQGLCRGTPGPEPGPEPRLGPRGRLLRPFALPRPDAAMPACAAFVDNGGRHPTVPRSPPGLHHSFSRLLSQALYVKNLSFCVRASATSYYNVVIVEPGAL
jgi:hypothetical protein